MNMVPTTTSPIWPIGVRLTLLDENQTQSTIDISPGITALVGPNGSGKTRALRSIKTTLDATNRVTQYNRKTHFLAAGRGSPFETYRAAVEHPGSINSSDAAVGHVSHFTNWWNLESVTGGLLVLEKRADLRLKVETRLQQLFDRSVQLGWSQQGLSLRISPMSGGSSYAANHEASGVLHLVGLLAAIHNNDIGALLIDEPEISLHPQHQAFLLEEMENVAGDPADETKKLIVIATHSASLLPLRRITDLPTIAFFNSVRSAPAQVAKHDAILKRRKLGALIARLSATHRMATFAQQILLVEGPSDEIVATQLAQRLGLRLLARNAQILPVTGKGEFGEAAKLFRLMNKKCTVLADLDALADDADLVNSFNDLPEAAAIADSLARTSLVDLDRDLRADLSNFMTRHTEAVGEAAKSYRDWSSKASSHHALRRVTLARALTDPTSFGGEAGIEAESLGRRYEVLLTALGKLGCFFLRKGAIENYYGPGFDGGSKPDIAAEEAAGFGAKLEEDLRRDYADILAALMHVAPNQQIDEDKLLQPKLGAALAAAFLSMNTDSSDGQLNAAAKATIGSDAEIFALANKGGPNLRIEVSMASPLFERKTFPFEIGHEENINHVIPNKLPGLKRQD